MKVSVMLNEDLLVDLCEDEGEVYKAEISSITVCNNNRYLGRSDDVEPRDGSSSLLEDRFYDVKRPGVTRAVLKI